MRSDGMMGISMWGIWLLGILILVLSVLGIAARALGRVVTPEPAIAVSRRQVAQDGVGLPHDRPVIVDMVVDNIGADVLAPCLNALAVGGRFVTIGRMSGVTKGELDVERLAERRLHLHGVSNRLRTPAQRAESAKRFLADLLPALGDGRLRPVIDRCFPLDQIDVAGAYLEADKHVGKVVIEI